MGNTDIHGVYKQTYRTDKQSGPMTIVFAKESSQEGVKEALLAGRSVVKLSLIHISCISCVSQVAVGFSLCYDWFCFDGEWQSHGKGLSLIHI